MSSHASSTTTRRRRRTAGLAMRRHAASSVSRVPAALSSSGRSRRLTTTRWPSGRVVRAGTEVEGVQANAVGSEVQVRAADRLGEAGVLVLGVDDEHLDALVEQAQGLQLGEIALARARAGQDDRVVVVLGVPIPADE